MNPTIEDRLETLLIMALCSDKSAKDVELAKIRRGNRKFRELDAGQRLPFKPMYPNHMYVLDGDFLTGEDRLYTDSDKLLLYRPQDIIGQEMEVMALYPESFVSKWFGYRKTTKPKDCIAIGKADSWFEMHVRHCDDKGNGSYAKRIIAFSNDGAPLTVFHRGQVISGSEEQATSCLCASVKEDHHRPNTMLASVKDSVEILFAVPCDDYKEMFSQREAPLTSTGRRRPILHWVTKHLRGYKPSIIPKHKRGIESFTIDGLTINIKFNQPIA